MTEKPRPIGDIFMPLMLWGWLTVAVGPWYVGVIIFLVCWLLNALTSVMVNWLTARRPE